MRSRNAYKLKKELHRTIMINEVGLRRVIEGSVEPFVQKLNPTKNPAADSPPAEPEKPQPEAQPTQNGEHQDDTPETQDSDPSSPKPLWEQFQQGGTIKPAEKPISNGREPQPPKSDEPAIPLWMQFQKKPEVPAPKAVTANPVAKSKRVPATPPQESELPISEVSTTTAPVEPETPRPETILQPQAREESSAPPSTPNPESMTLEQLEFSVLGLYGTSNRDMFVEHLFTGSSTKYKSILMRLHILSTWTMASQLIADEVFKKNNVNIYSPAAIMFTESVEEQYKHN